MQQALQGQCKKGDIVATAVSQPQESLRAIMIETQLKPSGVTNPRTATAFFAVPREDFVTPAQQGIAYAEAEPEIGRGRRLLLPRSLGHLVEAANTKPTDKALVIGAGTGYSAAILAELAGHVTALEAEAELAEKARTLTSAWNNITVAEGPLEDGWAENAPYTLILFDGVIEEFPDKIAGQLADGGRMVAIVHHKGMSRASIGHKSGNLLKLEPFVDATGPDIACFRKAPQFHF